MPLSLAGPMPSISSSRSGSESRMSRIWLPKRATSRSAIFSPMPLTAPEARKRRMPLRVAGMTCSQPSALNCRPNLGCSTHSPVRRRDSPGAMSPRVPTTVTWPGPAGESSRAMTYPFSGLW